MTALDMGLLLTAAPAKKPAGASSAWLIFVVIGAGFYFLIYRPQQRKAKALREQSKDFEVGDEVLTAGGIVGHVIDVDGERVTLETSVGASFVVLKQYVLRKLEEAVPSEDDDEDVYEDDQYDEEEQPYEEEEAASSDTTDEEVDPDDDDAAADDDADEEASTTEHRTGGGRSARRKRKVDGVDDNGGPEGPPVT